MTSNEVAISEKLDLAVDSEQTYWSPKQVAILRQLGVDKASEGDLAVFHHVCQRTGLDPFARQIYMIEREGKQTIQTGIDGFRLVARRAVDRSGEKLSIGEAYWCGDDGHWHDVWVSNQPPAAAKITVYRGGEPFPAIALYGEYVQRKRDGNVTRMWANRPAGQLAKCAEALALRKAFPQDLSGIYSDEEMDQADNQSTTRVVQVQADAPATDRMAAIMGTHNGDPDASDQVEKQEAPAEQDQAEPEGWEK